MIAAGRMVATIDTSEGSNIDSHGSICGAVSAVVNLGLGGMRVEDHRAVVRRT